MEQAHDFSARPLSDEEICKSELELYKKMWSTTKVDILQCAATKLELSGKYDEDLSKISSIISKLFPAFSSSTISTALDDKYKRDYVKPTKNNDEENTPTTSLEEFLFILQDNINSFNKSIKSILNRSRKDPALQKVLEETFTDSIHAFHDDLNQFMADLKKDLFDIEDMESLINYAKKLRIEMKILEEKTDWRVLLDASIKFGLKLQFTQQHFKQMGKKMEISGKWLAKHNNDLEFESLLETLRHCPKCNFDYSDYINRSNLAQKEGIALESLDPQELKCNDCKSTDIKVS